MKDGASEIYREGNERYIAVKYGVRDRDLGGAVEAAMAKVNKEVQLPRGYHLKWEGEYESARRARGFPIEEAAIEGAVLRLRPIMMTMLVATLGLLPAALSHEIGSDSQRPFAIVIVGGLIAALEMSVFLLPTLYVWITREGDVLPAAEAEVG